MMADCHAACSFAWSSEAPTHPSSSSRSSRAQAEAKGSVAVAPKAAAAMVLIVATTALAVEPGVEPALAATEQQRHVVLTRPCSHALRASPLSKPRYTAHLPRPQAAWLDDLGRACCVLFCCNQGPDGSRGFARRSPVAAAAPASVAATPPAPPAQPVEAAAATAEAPAATE